MQRSPRATRSVYLSVCGGVSEHVRQRETECLNGSDKVPACVCVCVRVRVCASADM